MALQPCPECKTEISSQARFCPRCGYPFEQKQDTAAQESKEIVTCVRRPFGIFLGTSMCLIGTLLLLSQFLIMLPFSLRHSVSPLFWQSHWQFSPMWRFARSAPVWQIFGLILVCLGIVQLILGSPKTKRTDIV